MDELQPPGGGGVCAAAAGTRLTTEASWTSDKAESGPNNSSAAATCWGVRLWCGAAADGATVAAGGVAEVGSPSIICTSLAHATSSESGVARYGFVVTFRTKPASAAEREDQFAETVPSAPTEALARVHAQAAAASFLAAAVE